MRLVARLSGMQTVHVESLVSFYVSKPQPPNGKLDVYGIHGVELSWFCNCLSERRQRVLLDGEHSDWTGLTKGVPQGSILGPMLFLLFVNDLSDVVEHCTVNLYADDTTIYSTDENPVVLGARMEKDLERVAN